MRPNVRWRLIDPVVLATFVVASCSSPTEPGPSIMEGTIRLQAQVRDLAYDQQRNLLYLAVPTGFRVDVLSLSTLQLASPVSTGPNRPSALDLSPGGDSLIVTLPEARAVGIIVLDPRRLIDTVRLDSFPDFGLRRPDVIRVLANSHAITVTTQESIGFDGLVVDYNLSARTVRWRQDVGYNFTVTSNTYVARSGDRKRLLMLLADTCCPTWAFVYNSDTDAFSRKVDTVDDSYPSISANVDGSRFLIGATLFSGTLEFLQEYQPSRYAGGPTTLNPDGASGFFATPDGVVQIRLSDGAVLRSFTTGTPPTALYALPTGRALVVVTPSTLSVFRLGAV